MSVRVTLDTSPATKEWERSVLGEMGTGNKLSFQEDSMPGSISAISMKMMRTPMKESQVASLNAMTGKERSLYEGL
ncbi:hypothetical protein E2C01_051469 [Portunus trituberculatus]|uniref:Uncharacterized protein n=1 Tax=Portunus trituberculatus TaxID=210409 RepID=A0A5B7GIZ9_PORTR|nr:hypothetical protein [Portunus trituberculatus]